MVARLFVPLILVACATAQATDIYVDDTATGSNNGSSWVNAYTDLQAALSAATSGDMVHVAEGTYKPTTGSDRSISFVIPDGVDVDGGYPNGGGTRDPQSNETVLSGEIGSSQTADDNSRHVVRVMEGSSAVLDGFTVRDGYASGNSTVDQHGGGLYIGSDDFSSADDPEDTVATFQHCLFETNVAQTSGAGACVASATATLEWCEFSGNSMVTGDSTYGGGTAAHHAVITLSDCEFVGNSAFMQGGGLFCADGSVTAVIECTFESNEVAATAYAHGGGACLFGDSYVSDSHFVGNTGKSGAGLSLSFAEFGCPPNSVAVKRCAFRENCADGGVGGGLWLVGTQGLRLRDDPCDPNNPDFGPARVTNCEFEGNHAAQGAGLMSEDSNVRIQNCLYVGNGTDQARVLTGCDVTCQYGGGASFTGDPNDVSPVLANCTFSDNHATTGGAVYTRYGVHLSISNGILWGDSTDEIAYTQGAPAPTVAYSDVEGGWPGDGNLDENPMFVASVLSGGNYRLLSCSPAIDAGDNDLVLDDEADLDGDSDVDEPTPYDLDDLARFVDNPNKDDTGNGDPPIVDMGAYENQGCAGDFDSDGDIDLTDLSIVLASYGCSGGGCAGDLECDGDVDLIDLGQVQVLLGSDCE